MNQDISLLGPHKDFESIKKIDENGDAEKEPIALAQTYFAIQTRKQELYEALPDDQKRLQTRGEVTDHNKKLFKSAKKSGVKNFGAFNDAGYKGLYLMSLTEIQKKKKLGKSKTPFSAK